MDGHHFIRVDSDGTVREKDGAGEPRIFKDWGVLDNIEESNEAVFAVKKEHKMFGHKLPDLNSMPQYLNFEQSVEKCIKEKQKMFSYHNHNFYIQNSNEDHNVFTIYSDNMKNVGCCIAVEEECLVEVLENSKEFVENTSFSVKPIIIDGKLVNYEEFKEKKKDKELEDKER